MFSIKQLSDFCILRLFKSDDIRKYLNPWTGNFIPIMMAADFIFQHCLENTTETILFSVTGEVIKWYNRADKGYVAIPSDDYVLFVGKNNPHTLTERGIYDPFNNVYYTEKYHKEQFATTCKIYTDFLINENA